MPWPSTTEYSEAIQNLRTSVSDEELRAGELARTSQGLPLLWSGNFADVYQVHCGQTGSTWAVKCFTRESPGLRDRYRQISDHLQSARLRFMVDFEFVEPGILVGGQWHPFLKMRWVEGLALDQFVEQYLGRPATLRQLLGLWAKLAARLQEAQIAHADLQHGNVILVPLPEGRLALRLIDYDGMYVPSLAGTRSGELGHPAYQHPQRLREGTYSLEVDRFSHLAIFCSIRCLMVGRRDLWRFHTGENLLFRERDFARPERSQAFRELWALPDAEARALVGRLFLAAQCPLVETPLLGDVLSNGSVVPLSIEEEGEVESALGGGAVVGPASRVSSPGGVAFKEKRRWWAGGPPPLPYAEVAETAGTVVDAASGTQPMPLNGGGQYGARALALGARLVRGAWHPAAVAVRRADGVLRVVAGEENAIIHNFLRMLALVLLVGLVFVSVRVASQPIRSAMALISRIMRPEEPAIPPTPPPFGPPGPPTEPPEGGEDPAGANYVQRGWAHQFEVPVEETNSIGMKLVLIPPGEFLMGSRDRDADDDEKPQHRVESTEPFYLGVTEVTQAQWQAVMESNPSRFQGDPKRPAEGVSWDEAMEFCRLLSQREGKQYRLPTEAEWEYACRAGSTTKWCSGMDEADLEDYAWYDESFGGSTHPVGRKKANGWGLYDMHGNVSEWCADGYDRDYYGISPSSDPRGPDSGSYRVLRGGSWTSSAKVIRSANRLRGTTADHGYHGNGFRVARTITGARSAPPGPKPPEPPDPKPPEPPRIAQVLPQTTVHLGGGVTMQMVLIPAEEFPMGSPDSDEDADNDEKPQHQVRITQRFYLGKYEVTQEQWQAVVGSSPSGFKGPKNPVEQVSWNECQEFFRRLNEKHGSRGATFRLPTEAEWEYACRAGSSTRWYFGEDEAGLEDYAWYDANSAKSTHPVGRKRPNRWGLYDMHGNVDEWCADWYDSNYYGSSPSSDPAGPNFGSSRVLRGGSWFDDARYTRSPYRDRGNPDMRQRNLGFRVARTFPGGPSAQPGPEKPEPLAVRSIRAQTVEAGKPLTVAVSVENAEQWEGRVQYRLAPGAPTGATIDAATGMFTWTPTQQQGPRMYVVTVLAVGPEGQKAERSFVVRVTRPNEATVTRPKQATLTSATEITVDLGGGVTMEMVLIPSGLFRMGSPISDPDASGDEKPQHHGGIMQPFYLGKHEVTQAQYERVMGENPSDFSRSGRGKNRVAGKDTRNYPVDSVLWEDAVEFCRRLSEKDGEAYRLPTEAEWEHACRAGSSTRWCYGDDEATLAEYAWYRANSEMSTHPVGQKRPNDWGLYDMHGNVDEWCADWYDNRYYRNSPPIDPQGPDSGYSRVFRGGAWGDSPRSTRSASRESGMPRNRRDTYGFRLARTP